MIRVIMFPNFFGECAWSGFAFIKFRVESLFAFRADTVGDPGVRVLLNVNVDFAPNTIFITYFPTLCADGEVSVQHFSNGIFKFSLEQLLAMRKLFGSLC